jgi:hypothetical protein
MPAPRGIRRTGRHRERASAAPLEHLPDRLLGLRMPVRLGVGDALVQQPGVQLVEVLNRSRGVKKRSRTSPPGSRPGPSPSPTPACRPPDRPGSGCTSAGSGDCRDALADEDRLHRRLHVVVAFTTTSTTCAGLNAISIRWNAATSERWRCPWLPGFVTTHGTGVRLPGDGVSCQYPAGFSSICEPGRRSTPRPQQVDEVPQHYRLATSRGRSAGMPSRKCSIRSSGARSSDGATTPCCCSWSHMGCVPGDRVTHA